MKKQFSLILIILIFIVINLVFNFSLWKELFGKTVVVSDNIITEFLVEASYQNILHFKNPFITNLILFPFTTNFSMNDSTSAYVIPFFFLRPFLDPHKSILLITLLGFLLNNVTMYILLIRKKIDKNLSTIIALVFGFTPFLSYRILGHYTYIPIYFFPLTFLIVSKLIETKKYKVKLLTSILLGLLIALILLSNFYYLLMILLGYILFAGFWLFVDNKKTLVLLKQNIYYFLLSFFSTIFFLIPWLLSVYKLIRGEGLIKASGFGGAITLSADVVSFITPSEYNPIYEKLFYFLSVRIPYFVKYNDFFLNSSERFAYPGIIILGAFFLIFLLKMLKKFPNNLWIKIKPFFFVSIFFAILSLGPFLKIFNRWSINLDGVAVIFPLPFLILHYVPGLSSVRAAARFTPAFIFLASIVVAYLINYLLIKLRKKSKIILLISLLLIFLFDQLYIIPQKIRESIPLKIYQYLRDKKDKKTVLEIPFTVRDGFKYIGFVHAIQPMVGQLVHGKPIIGGYLARIPNEVFNYYKNLNFIGYLSKIIDKGNYNPLKEKPRDINLFPYPYSVDTIKHEMKILNIKYIILKNDEKYSNHLLSLFKNIGFKEKKSDDNYILLEQ